MIFAKDIPLDTWAPVICNHLKKNGHYCCSWLGAVDKTKPGSAIHYCPYCKINYLHTVYADGRVEVDTIDGMIDSLDIPVEVGPIDVYRAADTAADTAKR